MYDKKKKKSYTDLILKCGAVNPLMVGSEGCCIKSLVEYAGLWQAFASQLAHTALEY